MSTWEERMAARAARGPLILDRQTARRVENERAAQRAIDAKYRTQHDGADDLRLWTGTCDVCGQPISLEHSYSVDGVIDVGVAEDGNVYTWIHHRTGPLQPDCGMYASRVYQVPE